LVGAVSKVDGHPRSEWACEAAAAQVILTVKIMTSIDFGPNHRLDLWSRCR
jgi:hypothetical protein